MIRKEVLIVLITFCLTATLFSIIPVGSQGVREYNPWYDVNDDGKIDLKDYMGVGFKFGTEAEGTPINKTALLIEVNATYAQLLSRIDLLNESLEDALRLQARFDSLNASVLELQSINGVLNETVTSLQEQLAALQAQTLAMQTTLLELESVNINLNATVAALLTRMSTLEANYSVSNLKLAPNAIPFASAYSNTVSQTTEIYSWINMSAMSVSITLNRTSHLLIMFSTEASNVNDNTADYILLRALVDSDVALPGQICLTPYLSDSLGYPYTHRHYLSYMVYSFNLYKSSVPEGTHTVRIQWKVTGHTGYVRARTLTVIALPA
jgi:hypothetical protein